MTAKEKKLVKIQQIKLGKTSKKDRKAFWSYILDGDMGVGLASAQELERSGFHVMKMREYDPERPD